MSAGAKPYRMNGVTLMLDEPWPYLEQAHGVISVVVDALECGELPGGPGPLNPELVKAALRGAETLVQCAGYSLDVMTKLRPA